MKAIKNLKAPDGYIYNGLMCLCGWPWVLKKCEKADAELFQKFKLGQAEDPQKAYKNFCAAYLEKWGEPCVTELRDD